ncbi:MAG TPA: UDP-2,3-diacylglucosamine diphosphatase LpxI [Phycisphaerae bacterium]|nr:UDP-2,3-diacylglucosamine diphosphatase LpxI [Phycisphaerae bacterium]
MERAVELGEAGGGRPLGLIAGQGALPLETARGMRAAGWRVICAAMGGQARVEELRPLCDRLYMVGMLRLNQWVRVLKRNGCREAVMVGRVGKGEMYQRFHLFRYVPDWRTARVWFLRSRHDKRTATLLKALADELECGGVKLIDGRPFVPESLASVGVMGRVQPTAGMMADIEFAWPLLKKLNELLIGQAVTCMDREIIAVEAVEGTDRLIERTGQFCRRKGWVLCKASNPNQDMRFDVPTVGVKTVEKLASLGGRALVVEAGRTIMLEKGAMIARAEELGVAVVGRE